MTDRHSVIPPKPRSALFAAGRVILLIGALIAGVVLGLR